MPNLWINEFDSIFFLTAGTMVFGTLGLLIRYCLKSKCEDLNICFGLIRVHRNVELETQEELARIEMGINDSPIETKQPNIDDIKNIKKTNKNNSI